MLKYNCMNVLVRLCTGFIWLRIATSGGHGSKPFGSIKGGEILD
jgi:hypothetical protein